MKESDVIVLRYLDSIHPMVFLSGLHEPQRPDLSVDVINETWRFGDQEFQIGSRGDNFKKTSVIGVYDRRNLTHLNLMIQEVEAITLETSCGCSPDKAS